MITAKEYVLLQKRNSEHRQFQVFFLVLQREVLCLFPKVISYTDILEKSGKKGSYCLVSKTGRNMRDP